MKEVALQKARDDLESLGPACTNRPDTGDLTGENGK